MILHKGVTAPRMDYVCVNPVCCLIFRRVQSEDSPLTSPCFIYFLLRRTEGSRDTRPPAFLVAPAATLAGLAISPPPAGTSFA